MNYEEMQVLVQGQAESTRQDVFSKRVTKIIDGLLDGSKLY